MPIEQAPFGQTQHGKPATLYTLTNDAGMIARITDFGAALVELHVPDAAGQTADVIAGFESVADYDSPANAKFGATMGPVTNRIGQARFTLDGQTYQLTANENGNTLHSGGDGFDAMLWQGQPADGEAGPSVSFHGVHPDGQSGFPGHVQARVTYTLTADKTLRIDYQATTDKPTPINMTNHAYFNLAGHDAGRIGQHLLKLYASHYTPTDAQSIPTGAIEPVQGTAMDFTEPRLIGDGLEALKQGGNSFGFDHNFLADDAEADGSLHLIAEVREPGAGRRMDVATTQPGVQLYTGGGLRGQTGKGGAVYHPLSLFCLETQHPADAVNHPNFPSTVVRPGQTYAHTAEFHFSTL
jgi:aldose 1-epimerase